MATVQNKPLEVGSRKLDAVRKRYTQEANKRLKPEGSAQFLKLAEAEERRLRHLNEDLWVDHEALNSKPSPVENDAIYKFFVLGAGFGGLQYAVNLIESGVASPNDIRLVDAAGGFGGTWYWNRYPGLHCDLESYIYMPLLEETGYIPEQKYATGEEIRLHAERIAARWSISEKALFRTDVKSVIWNEESELWTVQLTERRGPAVTPIDLQIHARYVYLAAGVLTRPQIPKIPGLLSFSGSLFHTARWNYAISGGSPTNQTLTGLQDKRVAVIGTAATAVGVLPQVAKYAKELYVIQRTPAYVKPRGQRATDPKEFRDNVATQKGWQFHRQCNFNAFQTNATRPGEENLVDDGWTDMPAYSAVLGSPSHGIVDPLPENLDKQTATFHALDLPHMDAVRSRIENTVRDPDTAEKLKPWYPSWCKRPTFSDTYLEMFNEPHVHLLDTNGQGPSHATEKGLVIDDIEYPLDVIIFGTGFHLPNAGNGSPAVRTGVQILGRGGRSLDEKWQTQGPATLHGYATNGFPNLFFSSSNQATITGNNVMMLGIIAHHVVYMIAEAERRVRSSSISINGRWAAAIIEVTEDAESSHTAEILSRAPYFSTLAGCTPGYFNGHGDAAKASTDPLEKEKRAKSAAWAEGALSFIDYISKWRKEGTLQGLDIGSARFPVVSKL
ncbi:pyridine nucleotide-disulfide oxidoreductase-like protein [Xylariales sp. PMI_506]|nr:pyridine nucleotide-disulfide oxidoreductase-like protein [Xylariales sp. PMI_506]